MISPPTEQEMLQVLDRMEQEHKRGWNDAIEAAAGYHDLGAKELRRCARNKLMDRAKRSKAVGFAEEHEAHAINIRKLKKWAA